MENYDALMDELTRLSIQKQAVMKRMQEIEEQLDKIKKEKANALLEEISERISELEKLGYHFEADHFDTDCGSYEWLDITTHQFRIRHKNEVIVD